MKLININIEPPEGLLSALATSTLPLGQAGPAFISIGASTSKVSFINIELPEGLLSTLDTSTLPLG